MAAMRVGWAAALALMVCVAVEELFGNNKGGSSREAEREQCRQETVSLDECRRFIQKGTREIPVRCCEELQNIREECRCEKIREMAKSLELIKQRAKQLPRICRISQQRCSIPSCKHSLPLS
ncbi:hypothetical protein AMTRI_Chr06g174920 [Amborella trichopoda]